MDGASYTCKYEIISHEDNFEGTGKIYVKVRVKGISKTFYRPIEDLYSKAWLEDFSNEDAAFLAVLFFSEKSNDDAIIKRFPTRKKQLTKNGILLSMFFVSCLIMSNLTASKIVGINLISMGLFTGDTIINFPAALIFFPLTYFFDDTLTEVYGFKVSRLVIWGGLVCTTLVMLGILLRVKLPPARVWHYQDEYNIIFSGSFRIFFASAIAYVIGEFFNSIILSKLKVLTSGRWLWLRVLSSTSVGVAIDSVIFCNLAFSGNIPNNAIWGMVVTQYVFKVSYEIFALPFTYWLTNYLKRADQIDYYDYETKFNPFSLSLEDRSIN